MVVEGANGRDLQSNAMATAIMGLNNGDRTCVVNAFSNALVGVSGDVSLPASIATPMRVIDDLLDTLPAWASRRCNETIRSVASVHRPSSGRARIGISAGNDAKSDAGVFATLADGIGVGDRVVLLFSDDQKRMSVLLAEDKNDLENGRLSKDSPLGKAVLGAEEGDEVEFRLDDKRVRKVLIEKVEKGNVAAAPMAPGVASMIDLLATGPNEDST